MLSKKHLQDICLMGKGAQECRYLEQDDGDYNKFCCLKLRAAQKKRIDEGVYDHKKDCKRKGIDPTTQGSPLGDNCAGYPYLKYLEQGYDKDKS